MKPIFSCPSSMVADFNEALQGVYNIENMEFKDPPKILDLGANIGGFTLWAQNRWPLALIHCYEPHPQTFELLEKNVEGVILHQVAVSNFTGTSFLKDGRHNCGEASIEDFGQCLESGHEVDVMNAADLPPADILKIDTEGSELQILENYSHWDQVMAVMLEWHRVDDKKKILDLMASKGFSCVADHRTAYEHLGMLKFTRGPIPKPDGVLAHSVNLLIGMPAYGGMTHITHNRSMMDLRMLLTQSQVRHDPRYLPSESLIPRARNLFGTMCLCDKDQQGEEYTHLLFLDVDIGFNARDIISLIALDKDIAALPYSAKDFQWDKIIKAVNSGVTDPEILRRCAGRPIINAHEHTVFQINEAVQFPQLGTGILLIKRKVFERFARFEPERKYKLMNNEGTNPDRDFAYDFFRIGVNPDTNYYDSEDYRFCLDARRLGFETWLWPQAVTTHTGNYAFTMDIPTQAVNNINVVDDPAAKAAD